MGNYKITHVRLFVRPSGVTSQRWLDRSCRNHNMSFPSTLEWCPSLRNFKIIKNDRLTGVLLNSYTTYKKAHITVQTSLYANDDSPPHSIWRLEALLFQCCTAVNRLIVKLIQIFKMLSIDLIFFDVRQFF